MDNVVAEALLVWLICIGSCPHESIVYKALTIRCVTSTRTQVRVAILLPPTQHLTRE